MKKILTFTASAMFIAAALVSCNSDDENGYTPTPENGYTPEPEPDPIAVTGVTLSQATVRLISGDTHTLIATVFPEDAENQAVVWSSSNEAVATVENGVVTIHYAGTAVITVATEDGNRTATSTAIVFSARGCNTNDPAWGESLGTITWGNVTNTDIESGTSTIAGIHGRPTQVWSGAVFASACREKTTFNGGSSQPPDFNADCRRAHTELTGHFFSWCAVMRFQNTLCPYPWRVPTAEDIMNLHQNLGFPVNDWAYHGNAGDFKPERGTGFNPQVGGRWGGARFTGGAGALHHLTNPSSHYWTTTEITATEARSLSIYHSNANPINSPPKFQGFALRCVR